MIKTTHIRLTVVCLCALVLSGCSVFGAKPPFEIVFDTPQEEVEGGVRLALHADDWDGYGESVDVYGEVLVVGASEWNYYGAGKAYVYRFSDGAWHEEAQLVAHDGGEQSWRFGASVALGEGIIAIGAPGSEDPQAAVDSGAVYLFEYDGQTWVETAKLTPTLGRAALESRTGWQTDFRRVRTFGALVALDGDTLAVAGATETETVYMFQRTENGWQEQAHIAVPALPERDTHMVSLSLLGDTLALSAFYTPAQSSRSRAIQGSVAVYLFERKSDAWGEKFRFIPEGDLDFVFFRKQIVGASVTLGGESGAANRLAIGLPGFPDWSDTQDIMGLLGGDPEQIPLSNYQTGAVYVYERTEGGWSQQATLRPAGWENPPGPGREFPASESDLEQVVFNEDTSTYMPATWVLGDSYSDNPDSSFFGATVALDENWLAVTAAYANTVNVFERQGQDWVYRFRATPGPEAWEDFGQVAAISSSTLLLGAPGEFGYAAYVFDLCTLSASICK